VLGHLDRFDTTIAGWAFDPTAPGQPVEIVVEAGDREVYRCAADLHRMDLLDAIGETDHGFSFDLTAVDSLRLAKHLSVYACGSERRLLGGGPVGDTSIVAVGQEDWLFLNADSNNVNLRMAGAIDIDPEQIHASALLCLTRESTLALMGVPYAALVFPEKNVLCGSLWGKHSISNHRPSLLIKQRVERLGGHVMYPVELFTDRPTEAFHKTDTHLSGLGYLGVYRLLRQTFPRLFLAADEPVPVRNPAFCGDLGSKFEPPRHEIGIEIPFPDTAEHRCVFNSIPQAMATGTTLRGNATLIVNRRLDSGLVMVFGTSSAYNFLPALSHAFRHTFFVWENTFDYDLIAMLEPDLVLWLVTERLLPTMCNDLGGLPAVRTGLLPGGRFESVASELGRIEAESRRQLRA